MPKKYKRKGGGIFDNLGQTFSNWGTSISQGAQGLYNKAKQGISGQSTSSGYMPTYSSSTPAPLNATPQSNYQPTYQTSNTSNYGGTKKRNRKNKRGGYRDNVSLTNLASHAAPFSGNTAQPHNWVGGKTNRRRKSSSKTKKRHHKSKRH